ncbi:MAG: hypothetical protein IH845_02585 [Nanoarchaeota archaeon]|nr:hypothetical protein [Nanoarchaeota archaeon]
MKKFLVLFTLIFLSVSLVSAGHSYIDYSHPDEIVIRKTITFNEDRYRTYDYRHGYTYRTTDEYKDRRAKKIYLSKSSYKRTYSEGYHGDYDYIMSTKSRHYYPKDPYYEKNYYRNSYDYTSRYNHNDWQYSKSSYRSKGEVHFEYVSHLRLYKKVECYHSPPRDKLFYRKCI